MIILIFLSILSKLNLLKCDCKDWRELISLCKLAQCLLHFASGHHTASYLKNLFEGSDYQLIDNQPLLSAFNRLLMFKNGLAKSSKVNELITMCLILILINTIIDFF